jgi:hypothetical protein
MKLYSPSIRKQSIAFGLLSVLWITYLIIRAYYVPITFDEAATFFHFVHRGDMWFFDALPDANNHLVNSLLTYLSYHLFGVSKLALRLPNLISAIIFLYFLFRISLFLKNITLRWVFIISLMFSHYFVEFFAVSRGYGLSMAFLFGVLYHLIKFSETTATRHILFVSLFLLLAEFSNLSILVLSTAIIGYQIIFIIINKNITTRPKIFQTSIITVLQVLPLIFAGAYMFFLKEKGSLYYGDSSGFWSLTVVSLIKMLTGSNLIVMSISIIVLTAFVIISNGYILANSKFRNVFQPYFTFTFLLITSILGILLLASFFGVNDPEDRVAMYFIPLFFGAIIISADKLIEVTKKWGYGLVVIPLLFFPVHFFYVMNLQYVNGYKTEVIPERFYEVVINDKDNQGEFPATIGGYRMRMFCWTYLNFVNGGSQNLIDYQDYPEVQSDYQIVDINENPEWLDYYDVIDTEEVLGRSLLKRKKKNELELISSADLNAKADPSKREYFDLYNCDTDTLIGESLLINIDIDIHSDKTPFHAWVILHINDNDNNTIQYKYIPLDWLQTNWDKGGRHFKHTFLTGKISPNSNSIKIYIWNIDKVTYTLNSSEIELYYIED